MSPLALVAIGYALGILLGETLGVGWFAAAGLVLASTALMLPSWRSRRLALASLLWSLALGSLAAAGSHPITPPHLTGGKPLIVTARVVEAPERALGRTHVTAALESISPDARRHRARTATGLVRVAIPGDLLEPLVPGDRIRLRARLLRPHGFHEPDSPDPDHRFAERHLVAVAGVASPASVARLLPTTGRDLEEQGSSSFPRRLRGALERLRLRLLDGVARQLSGDRRALVESLVLGERGHVTAELDEAFRRAGVTHVLSVSGLHLAIAGFLAYVGLRRLLLLLVPSLTRRIAARRVAALAAIPATGLYTLLTGAAIATVRSCAATWLVLLGVATSRPAAAQGALACGALLLLGAEPLALYDPSLQLSFGAALGTVLLGAPMARWVVERSGGRLEGEQVARRIGRAAIALVAASTAALLVTAPITAWHFAQAAPAGLWANLIVVPLAELWVLPVGLVGCLLAGPTSPVISSLASPLAGVVLRLAGLGAAAMAGCVRFLSAHAPEGRVPAPRLIEALLFYAAIGALALWLRSPRRSRLVAVLSLLALFGAALVPRVVLPRLRPALTVTFLDVGQGDAALVTLPDGRRLLVDGGGSFDPRFDPGAQVLVPWLRREGIDRLDVVALTHPHPDHAGGLATVVASMPVGEVWTNGARSSLPALLRLEEVARARGVPVVRPHPIEGGGARLIVLHPIVDGLVRAPAGWSENDGSIVLRLDYAGRAVLLTGDVERRAEARLLAQAAATATTLHADVLKAGHHCSRTSSTAAFLEAVDPSWLICSVGESNPWGFPAPEVVSRADSLGAVVERTDLDGAVTVRIARSGDVTVETVRDRPDEARR